MFYVLITVQYGDRACQRLMQHQDKITQSEVVEEVIKAFTTMPNILDRKLDHNTFITSLVQIIAKNLPTDKSPLREFIARLREAGAAIDCTWLEGEDLKILPINY